MLIVLFLVSQFNFLFVLCGGLSWLAVSFLLHVKYTLSYRIVDWWHQNLKKTHLVVSGFVWVSWLVVEKGVTEEPGSCVSNFVSILR